MVLSAVPECACLALQGRQQMAVPAGGVFQATRSSLQMWLLLLHFIMQMHIVYLTLHSYEAFRLFLNFPLLSIMQQGRAVVDMDLTSKRPFSKC